MLTAGQLRVRETGDGLGGWIVAMFSYRTKIAVKKLLFTIRAYFTA